MMSLGAMTLVVTARGSVELGGLNAAAIGVGMACFGPLIGAAADRFGQRPTLLAAAAAHSAMLAALAWVAFSPLPDWAVLIAAFAVGATGPQTSPMSRSRLVMIVQTELPVSQRPRAVNSALVYESAVDEIIYVFGPVVVGVLASAFGAAAPVVASAVMTLFFVSAFALHRTSTPPKSREERAATLSPVSALWQPAVLITVFGTFAMGMLFGSTITSLMAFMSDRGRPEAAGLMYGVMGVGSAILAIGVAWLPPRFTLRHRWLAFSALIVVGGVVLQAVQGIPSMVAALVVLGLGSGPMLVTLFGFGAARTPEGRSATVMSMLGTGIMLGQALTSALAGILAENVGTQAALVVPLVSGALLFLAGLANLRLAPSPREATA